MNPRGTKHVEDVKNRITALIWKVCIWLVYTAQRFEPFGFQQPQQNSKKDPYDEQKSSKHVRHSRKHSNKERAY
jgi:hypothetical protein